MTKRYLEKLGKQLIATLPNFTVKNNLLFLRPIGHTLRGICLSRSGSSESLFYAKVFIQPLYVPPEKYLVLNIGWRLGGGSRTWDIKDHNLRSELSKVIEEEALPFLNHIKSPRDVVGAAESLQLHEDPIVRQAIAYSFIRVGDTANALAAIAKLLHLLGENEPYPWQQAMADQVEGIKTRLLESPDDVQKQLEAWEAETVRNLGLEVFR